MAILKQITEFSELFTLDGSSQVYGIANNTYHYTVGIVWKFDKMTAYGPFWLTTTRFETAEMFRNRVIKIKNIKLFPKKE